MIDREQIRRDERLRKTFHVLFNCECRHDQTAHEAVCELDALLAELEQVERRQQMAEADARKEHHRAERAERERDEARVLGVSDKITAWYDADARVKELERERDEWKKDCETMEEVAAERGDQLAKVPALVEALESVVAHDDHASSDADCLIYAIEAAREALAAWGKT